MDRTLRVIIVVAGCVLFVAAALASFGVVDANATGLALLGFACWLASTLP